MKTIITSETKTVTIDFEPIRQRVDITSGESLLEAAQSAGAFGMVCNSILVRDHVFISTQLQKCMTSVIELTSFASPQSESSWIAQAGIAAALTVAGVILLTVLLFRWRLTLTSIRSRVMAGFLSIALLSAVGVSIGSVTVGYFNGRQQVIDRLESVVALKEFELKVWADSLQDELLDVFSKQYDVELARNILDLALNQDRIDLISEAMRVRLRLNVNQSLQMEEIFMVDRTGRIVLSTDVEREGAMVDDQIFFRRGLAGPSLQLPFRPEIPGGASSMTDKAGELFSLDNVVWPVGQWAYASRPVISLEGELLGLIVGRASAGRLNEILSDQIGLGETGKLHLSNSKNELLLVEEQATMELEGERKELRQLHIDKTDAVTNRTNKPGLYLDFRGKRVVGVYSLLSEFEATLAAEQEISEAFRSIYTTLAIDLGVVLMIMLVAAAGSYFITQSITHPLVDLVDTASRIAEGDLQRVAPINTNDEVGSLAIAFNTMTARLRYLIGSLERRVEERTEALQEAVQTMSRRTVQLEASAMVSREISSIFDIDELLTRIVELIRDAFRYYQVHIFLVNQETNQLALRASSDCPTPRLQYLEIGGGSLNSQAAHSNKPLVVNDVTQSRYFLHDEQFPDTRSELVIPLRVGKQVIGTLDVHSTELNAFNSEDTLVMQSLGDQITIAIENARLYDLNRELAILEERNRLARELHDSVTQTIVSTNLNAEAARMMIERDPVQAAAMLDKLQELTQGTLIQMRSLIQHWRPAETRDKKLIPALRRQFAEWQRRDGMVITFEVDGESILSQEQENAIFRIVQEAINNVAKHAQSDHVNVSLRLAHDKVSLLVEDHGVGFDPTAHTNLGFLHLGLIIMRERAELLGGSFRVESNPGEGTRIIVEMPIGEKHG